MIHMSSNSHLYIKKKKNKKRSRRDRDRPCCHTSAVSCHVAMVQCIFKTLPPMNHLSGHLSGACTGSASTAWTRNRAKYRHHLPIEREGKRERDINKSACSLMIDILHTACTSRATKLPFRVEENTGTEVCLADSCIWLPYASQYIKTA